MENIVESAFVEYIESCRKLLKLLSSKIDELGGEYTLKTPFLPSYDRFKNTMSAANYVNEEAFYCQNHERPSEW